MTEDPAPDVAPAGLEHLFRDRYDRMVRVAYLLCHDRAVAEELVQDSFLALQRRWDDIENPPAYLRTAVVNACRSWGRREQMGRERTPRDVEDAPGADHVADELWDALATLNDRQRAAVVLRFYEDASDDDIAVALGCRPATVRTTIHRALRTLRPQLTTENER